jgi:2-dehydro-3-deoxygluconokinase
MYDVVTVGEGMLRLSPPRYERIRRARTLEVHICGSQGNVACDIARLGLKTAFVTKLPDNALGLLANDHYLSCGVDTSHIKFVPGSRLGVNYLEFGATPRASAVVYDRKHSAASTIAPGDFPWDEILKGVRLAYTDGIFPGLSPSCRDAAVEFVAAARRNGCLVGFDVNYREHLWPSREAKEAMSEIIRSVDILITTQWDSEIVFGYRGSYEEIIRQFHRDFGCKIVAITLREVHDVIRGAWNTMVLCEGKVLHGQKFDIDVIDRFGAGDSWGSGFLYAYLQTNDAEYAMNFGNAVCALHHTIPGDVAHITPAEVEAIMNAKDFREKR